MKCTACRKEFHPQPESCHTFWENDDSDDFAAYAVNSQKCPSCQSPVIYIDFGRGYIGEGLIVISDIREQIVVYPPSKEKPSVAPEIPAAYRKDLLEARAVLEHSPKASAALSRRLLQHVLREELGIKEKDLSKEIDIFISSGKAPSYLSDAVDAIRQVGNFAAHPLKFQNSGEIADVEVGEAEWTLEVVEAILDFACVQPVKLKQRRDALEKKLQDLGKPPLKRA